MRNYIKIGFLGAALACGLAGCKKDFLNVVPLGEQTAETYNDYSQLMNDPAFYLYSSAGGWQEPMLMGDDVAAEAAYFVSGGTPQMQRLFQWSDTIFQVNDAEPWDLIFQTKNMYQANKIINEVMSSTGGTADQKAELQAEAKASRAWLNLEFVNFYGKPYNAATAGADPGWPIITTADATQATFTRASVQAVYDTIVGDLKAALPLLPATQPYTTRFTKAGAEALLARVYLYMGKFPDALAQCTAALNDLSANGAALYNYTITLGPGGSFLPVTSTTGPAYAPGNNKSDIKESVLAKVFYNGRFAGNFLGNNGIVLAPWAQALYGADDLRLQLYSNLNTDGSLNPGGRLRKYSVTYSRCGVQLSDLYLMSAECKARTGDLAGAKTDVETLRLNRMPAASAVVPAPVAGDATALLKFILDERVREFAAEGIRWFDMRRLSVDPLFTGQVYTHTMYNDDAGNTSATYTLRQPDRLTLKLPPTIINANPNMPNNP